ncbi:MAG: flippase-like domain-containing protein, partial [Deltaproteobacteria bacterium]|nr:flippase-like domain-containing protein [Deltaproteobacteria bacterium]
MLKTSLKWIAGILIGAFFIYLSAEEWPLGNILAGGVRLEGFRLTARTWSLNIVYIPIYFLSLAVMHVFRTWRWQPLLNPIGGVDFWTLNRICSIGFLSVFILPLRLGEFVRPYLLAEDCGIRKSTGLATIIVERTFDGVIVAAFLIIALVFMPRDFQDQYIEIRIGAYAAVAVFSAIAFCLLMLFIFRKWAQRVFDAVISVFPARVANRLSGIFSAFTEALKIIPDYRNLAVFILISVCYWLSNAVGLYVFAKGFSFESEITFPASLAMMATIVIGMMIPNSPANVGSFWFFILKPLALYGIAFTSPVAVIFALSVWSLQLLQLIVFGGYFVFTGKAKLSSVFAMGG